jgi:hypothetical protein
VLVAGLGLHLGDGLDLALQDEETLVVQIYTPVLEKCGDCGEVGGLAVDIVGARVVLEGSAGDDEVRVGKDFGGTTRLMIPLASM